MEIPGVSQVNAPWDSRFRLAQRAINCGAVESEKFSQTGNTERLIGGRLISK
jgi:hypothetical protein